MKPPPMPPSEPEPPPQNPPEEVAKPEQRYDRAMRDWVEHNLSTVAGWLDPTVAGLPPSAYRKEVTVFTGPTVTADMLTTAGKNRLMHIEYEIAPRQGLVNRMYNYRGQIQSLFPRARLSQHVIVLGDRRVRGHDDANNGFILFLDVVYLRERDAEDYLKNPVLAPLAVLTRGRKTQREQSFGAALRVIQGSGLPNTGDLLQTAENLAAIRLDPITISRVRKENGMTTNPMVEYYRDTEVGHALQREARDEGREQEREKFLRGMLQRRFGSHPDTTEIVQRMTKWSMDAILDTVPTAPSIEALLTAEPPN